MKRTDLIRHIKQHGCKKHTRSGAKHEIYVNKNNLVSTIPRHREIPTGTVKAICKQFFPL
jgi:mRNA interferase HicA